MSELKYGRKDAAKEIQTENAMRVKVWRKVGTKPVRFMDMGHQRRYEITTLLEGLLNVMTDREWLDLITRKEAADAAAAAQQRLF